jgi:hypothetical protein
MEPEIPRRIVPSPACLAQSPRATARQFRRLLDGGVELRVEGRLRRQPRRLLSLGYTPKHAIELFDTTFFLTDSLQNYYLRFFVAYVVQGRPLEAAKAAHARIFYKDASLVWRSASHVGGTPDDLWIGKGDVEVVHEGDEEVTLSREATTDLPLELQAALEALNRLPRRVPTDDLALHRVLRHGGDDRVEAFRDFTEPRRRARSNPRNRVNRGRSVAWFARKNDPASLRFVPGYEPDFARGILEVGGFTSKIYGGAIERYRILSRNRSVQWMFYAGPRQVWIVPPQATTTQLSSYGVRTVDVEADEDLFIPGYEYHFEDDSEEPPVLYSQIPPGFAGPPCELDDARADASPWLDRTPLVREFRRKVLRAGRRAPWRRAAARRGGRRRA